MNPRPFAPEANALPGCATLRRSKKEPAASYSRAGESRTTLGDGALDFRVRNGNGYFSPSVATGEKPELEAKENHNPHARAREIPHLVKCVEI